MDEVASSSKEATKCQGEGPGRRALEEPFPLKRFDFQLDSVGPSFFHCFLDVYESIFKI